MPFDEVESISNLKRHIYRICEQVVSYNKQKDELRKGEVPIMYIIEKATITFSKMKFAVHILVNQINNCKRSSSKRKVS